LKTVLEIPLTSISWRTCACPVAAESISGCTCEPEGAADYGMAHGLPT
jgi:hypothetical protein